MNQISADLIHRAIDLLESIANSLSTLAEETKANKELKQTLISNVDGLQESIEKMKEDPFDLDKRN
ncbi:hypothetical protein KUA55_10370 [Enterococcus sp. ALS3]|uniref:Uncharacterized protein n=1 Tax=Enterococcus alishanensis TaxID=1303817 RepID=A0ABS6TDV4_9ENTE|nr:hypothetical protein [Enterococcus alishanensis]MBV7391086.1 hypothetical protein [Enterococcus alishanensis]